MPFTSKRQQRAMFAGKIPGMTDKDAKQWASETDFKDLPERAPAEKGKPTLRSKAAALASVMESLEPSFAAVLKTSAMGQVNSISKNVGRFSGMQTANALKAPGVAASQQAVNPRRNLKDAVNSFKTGL